MKMRDESDDDDDHGRFRNLGRCHCLAIFTDTKIKFFCFFFRPAVVMQFYVNPREALSNYFPELRRSRMVGGHEIEHQAVQPPCGSTNLKSEPSKVAAAQSVVLSLSLSIFFKNNHVRDSQMLPRDAAVMCINRSIKLNCAKHTQSLAGSALFFRCFRLSRREKLNNNCTKSRLMLALPLYPLSTELVFACFEYYISVAVGRRNTSAESKAVCFWCCRAPVLGVSFDLLRVYDDGNTARQEEM
jgi:hypothetical protein